MVDGVESLLESVLGQVPAIAGVSDILRDDKSQI